MKTIIMLVVLLGGSLGASLLIGSLNAQESENKYDDWNYYVANDDNPNARAIAYTDIGDSFFSIVCNKKNDVVIFASIGKDNTPKTFKFWLEKNKQKSKTYNTPNQISIYRKNLGPFKLSEFVHVKFPNEKTVFKFSLKGANEAISRLEKECH